MSDKTPASKPWYKKMKFVIPLVIVLVIIGVTTINENDEKNEAKQEETTVEETTTEEVEETTTEEETEEPETPERSDEEKAADYEAWLKSQYGVDSFTEVLMQDSTLWAGYINGITANSNNMHVRLQVDRKDPEAKEMAKRASKAIASLAKASKDPRVGNVYWVIVEDGAGTVMSQEML